MGPSEKMIMGAKISLVTLGKNLLSSVIAPISCKIQLFVTKKSCVTSISTASDTNIIPWLWIVRATRHFEDESANVEPWIAWIAR